MTTKYALLNPADGSYSFFDTEDEVKVELAKRAIEFFISHGHGVAYNKVIYDENNWETWEAVNTVELKVTEPLVKEVQQYI